MAGIDQARTFIPVRIAVLTVSDTRTAEDDKSGNKLVELATVAGHEIADRAIVRDDISDIRYRAELWINDANIDCIISTGGTGFTGRDVTPEALQPLFEKHIDGFSALFHMLSYRTVATSTMQSRACAGVVRGTYIFCLPGSPGAVGDAWDGILKYQLDSRHRPCNLVEIMPRLSER